jgi:hypothetical protein
MEKIIRIKSTTLGLFRGECFDAGYLMKIITVINRIKSPRIKLEEIIAEMAV